MQREKKRERLSLIVPTAACKPLKVPYKHGPVACSRNCVYAYVYVCVEHTCVNAAFVRHSRACGGGNLFLLALLKLQRY